MAARRGLLALPWSGGTRSRVPELNLLPDAFRRRLRLSVRSSLLLALAFELLIALSVLNRPTTRPRMEALFSQVFGGKSPAEVRIENLQNQLVALEKDLTALKAGRQEIASRSTNWGALLGFIFSAIPEGVGLERVSQTGAVVVINGSAQNLSQVNAFQTRLVATREIGGATVTSIQQAPKKDLLTFTMSIRLR